MTKSKNYMVTRCITYLMTNVLPVVAMHFYYYLWVGIHCHWLHWIDIHIDVVREISFETTTFWEYLVSRFAVSMVDILHLNSLYWTDKLSHLGKTQLSIPIIPVYPIHFLSNMPHLVYWSLVVFGHLQHQRLRGCCGLFKWEICRSLCIIHLKQCL